MTSKAVISQLEVNERRLKGIYDQLEGGNFKKAIFEADKVLKKNSNLLPAKVLKGLALYRLGKSIEAYSLIDEVAKLTPTDENTLNSLSYFYKESNQKSKIVEIYEEAYKKCPNREDICANLFYCHTKNFDFLSQQKVAAQLKKINVNHIEYVMWPIISNVLHGVYNNDLRLVKLGEAVLARYLKSNSILTAEIIEFFMYTLEKSDKLVECLEWLDSTVLKDVIENNQNKELFSRYKISVLLKLDRKSETCDLYWTLLQNNRDDVCLWRDYIDVVVHLNFETSNPHSIASLIDKLQVTEQQSMANKVAVIHLSLKLEIAKHELSPVFGSKIDKIINFFTEFGDKPSCLYDLHSFMAMETFSANDRNEIIDKIVERTGHLSVDKITDTKSVERHVAIECVKRAVLRDDKADLSLLTVVYEHGLQFSKGILASEIKPCDNFAKLAATRYYDLWLDNKSDCQPLVDAVSLLSKAIEHSSANYHLRLQLSHLLGMLGCQDLLVDQFNDLEIKQLMWDSLGYFYILPMLSLPSFQHRIQFFKRNIDRKQKNKLEIEDSLVTCYKLGNYSQIPEIIEFHRDIEASVMSRLTEMEILYVNTIMKSNTCDDLFEYFSSMNLLEVESSDPEFDILQKYSTLKDFRDLTTSPDFSPFDKLWTDEHQKTSFSNILLWTANRCLTVRAFFWAAKLTMETVVKLDRLISDSSVSFASEISNYYKTLSSTRHQLADIWTKMDAMTGSYRPLSDNLTGCIEPPQATFSRAYIDTITSCVDSLTGFHDAFVRHLSPNALTDWTVTITAPLKFIVDGMLNTEMTKDNLFTAVPALLNKLTISCELFSCVTLTLGMIETMSRPMRPKTGAKRRNKKKKADTTDDVVSDPKKEKMKSFLDTTNFHKLPDLFIEMAGSVEQLVSRTKNLVASMDVTNPVLLSIGNSWKISLDDSLSFIGVKKGHMENIGKFLNQEPVHQCSCQMNHLNLEHHH